jgi:hypothetical protein
MHRVVASYDRRVFALYRSRRENFGGGVEVKALHVQTNGSERL